MSVDSSSKPTYPELTAVHRLASVPVIHDSLTQLDSIITSNSYTNYVKVWATAWGTHAYKISEPYGAKLAPVITTADGYANKGIDLVQQRFPYPFSAPTDEVIQKVKAPADQAYGVATAYAGAARKSVEDNLIVPSYSAATELDKKASPYVDQLEAKVRVYVPARSSEGTASPNQIGRVFGLGMDVKDHVVEMSVEQFKQLQRHSVVVQRATDGAQQLNSILISTTQTAKQQSHEIASALMQSLETLQAPPSSPPTSSPPSSPSRT